MSTEDIQRLVQEARQEGKRELAKKFKVGMQSILDDGWLTTEKELQKLLNKLVDEKPNKEKQVSVYEISIWLAIFFIGLGLTALLTYRWRARSIIFVILWIIGLYFYLKNGNCRVR